LDPLLIKLALYLILLIGLVTIPLGMGGNFLILAAAVGVAFLTDFQAVGWVSLVVLGALVAAGEIFETALGPVMARRYGASRWGMLGALVGGLLGVIPGTMVLPVVDTIVGSFVGSAAGAILAEWIHQRHLAPGLRAGWGATLGRALAGAIKLAIGLIIATYLVIRTLDL